MHIAIAYRMCELTSVLLSVVYEAYIFRRTQMSTDLSTLAKYMSRKSNVVEQILSRTHECRLVRGVPVLLAEQKHMQNMQ